MGEGSNEVMLKCEVRCESVRRYTRIYWKQSVKCNFFIRKHTVVLFRLLSYLNFTCCFIGLLDVTDFLQAVSAVAFRSHRLFLSPFYGCTIFGCLGL